MPKTAEPDKSPQKPGEKKTDNYDDTAEVEKILETVISAQAPAEEEPPPVTAEESKPPSAPPPPKTDKPGKGRTPKKTATPTAAPSHTKETPEISLPAPPPVSAGLADELDAVKKESATLKNALAQKNKLLSGGFVRLNLYLKHIRSQLDQLQAHLDKLSQESLKEIRSPLLDKTSWPKYSKPATGDAQWKQFVDEIEKLYKKVSPPIDLKMEDWPARDTDEKTEYDRDWDKTLVHLRGSARKRKELEKGELSELQESKDHLGEEKVMDSFGAVRESLRRIQDLMESPTEDEQEPEIQEHEEQKQDPGALTAPDTEISPTRSEKLSYRQFVRDLKHSDRVIRIRAAEVLAKSKLKSTPEVLIDAWCDETDPEVRSAIIKTLVELDYKEAVAFFTDALDDSDLKVQMAALAGLYKFETSKKTTAGLLKALRSRYYHIRRRAVTYLGWNKASAALPQLLKLLKDENEFVRKATISTLFLFRNKESIPHLIDTLHDSSLSVRKKAIEVLYRWTGLRNDFKENASGSKRIDGIDRWKEWWEKNGKTFRISQIYRVQEPSKELPAPPAPPTPPATKKRASIKPKAKKKKTSATGPKRPSRRRPPTAMEEEHLVLATDIFPEPASEPVSTKSPKKKATPHTVNEKNLQNVISASSGGITLMELGDKFGVKWQSLTPMVKKLVEAEKIKKVKNKYLKK